MIEPFRLLWFTSFCAVLLAPDLPARSLAACQAQREAKPRLEHLRGKVVELGVYARRELGLPFDDDVGRSIVALVLEGGDVVPLIKDVRSRGFFLDARFRDRPVELHVMRYDRFPFVRLVDAYSINDGRRFHLEYWCDICAITTYEPGPCPCCQDPIELRERLAD